MNAHFAQAIYYLKMVIVSRNVLLGSANKAVFVYKNAILRIAKLVMVNHVLNVRMVLIVSLIVHLFM